MYIQYKHIHYVYSILTYTLCMTFYINIYIMYDILYKHVVHYV